jgi:hypothetical protein
MKQLTVVYLRNTIYSLLLLSLLVSSCSGQVKTDSQSNNGNPSLSHNTGQPKLIRTLGSNPYQDISAGLEDHAGNLWFGTSTEGVYRYDGKLFTQFTTHDGLSSDTILSMLEDTKGNIWFGTMNGLSRYDGKVMKQIPIKLQSSLPSHSSESNTSHSLNEVHSIMQDKKGMLWLGTTADVICYDGNTFSRFLDNHTIVNDSSLTLRSVQCMFEDRHGNIWFGSGPMAFEGIGFYNGKSLTKFRPKKEVWIRKITEDVQGTLLFDTRHNGLITYDGNNFTDFPAPKNLRKDLLNTILADSKGNIWYAYDYVNDNDIATGGLWKFDGKSFTEFTKQDGLSNTSVSFILEDRTGSIWIGTRNVGLYRYDGKTFSGYSE